VAQGASGVVAGVEVEGVVVVASEAGVEVVDGASKLVD